MTNDGKLGALQSFIKGRLAKTPLYEPVKEEASSIVKEESNEEVEMKTFFFSSGPNPEQAQQQEESWLPGLTKKQRIIGFFTLLATGIFCFTLAGMLLPVLVLRIRKFVLLYTMGSVFTVGSFSVLWGPMAHIKHLCSYQRLPFTSAYFGAMFATLYSALVLKKTILTLLFAILQITALVWYVVSYVPGGTTGLKFFSKLCASFCTKTVSKTLPV
eukprot:gene15164-16723_t